MSLTRHEFEEGLQLWLERDGRAATPAWAVKEQVRRHRGWLRVWHTADPHSPAQPYTSHKYLQSLGRPVLLQPGGRSQLEGVDLPSEEEADEAAATSTASTMHKLTGSVDIYVVWSPVYQVPALLFRGYDSGAWHAFERPILTQLD